MCLIAASSIEAGSTQNSRPAAASSFCLLALADARIRGSSVNAVPTRQQFHDCRSGFLDRTAGHVDNRPMSLDEDATCLPHFASHCLDIGILGGVVVMQHVQAVAAELYQPLRI